MVDTPVAEPSEERPDREHVPYASLARCLVSTHQRPSSVSWPRDGMDTGAPGGPTYRLQLRTPEGGREASGRPISDVQCPVVLAALVGLVDEPGRRRCVPELERCAAFRTCARRPIDVAAGVVPNSSNTLVHMVPIVRNPNGLSPRCLRIKGFSAQTAASPTSRVTAMK